MDRKKKKTTDGLLFIFGVLMPLNRPDVNFSSQVEKQLEKKKKDEKRRHS